MIDSVELAKYYTQFYAEGDWGYNSGGLIVMNASNSITMLREEHIMHHVQNKIEIHVPYIVFTSHNGRLKRKAAFYYRNKKVYVDALFAFDIGIGVSLGQALNDLFERFNLEQL